MPGFENYAEEARRIEREIVRQGIVLGIDWSDEGQVRQLAREALECRMDPEHPECRSSNPRTRARIELFGLAQLMLKVMAGSAGQGYETHGGPVWKTFGRALWEEAQRGGGLP